MRVQPDYANSLVALAMMRSEAGYAPDRYRVVAAQNDGQRIFIERRLNSVALGVLSVVVLGFVLVRYAV